jgi:hypothetical protein
MSDRSDSVTTWNMDISKQQQYENMYARVLDYLTSQRLSYLSTTVCIS